MLFITVEGLYLCTYGLLDLPNSRMSGASPLSYLPLTQNAGLLLGIHRDFHEGMIAPQIDVMFLNIWALQLSQQPIIAVYETSARSADHAVRCGQENVAKQQF
jgi:hypothetical protein